VGRPPLKFVSYVTQLSNVMTDESPDRAFGPPEIKAALQAKAELDRAKAGVSELGQSAKASCESTIRNYTVVMALTRRSPVTRRGRITDAHQKGQSEQHYHLQR
jgi:hypothetical protein